MKKSWGLKDNGQDIHREFTGVRRGAEEMLNTPSEKRNRLKPWDSIRRVGANLATAGVRAAGGPPGTPDRAAWGALGTTAYNKLLTAYNKAAWGARGNPCAHHEGKDITWPRLRCRRQRAGHDSIRESPPNKGWMKIRGTEWDLKHNAKSVN